MADNIWLTSALWMGLALLSSLISIRVGISVALIEIIIGAFGGNVLSMPATPWVSYLAGVGAILLTFLAGAEIDPAVIKKHFWTSTSIGVMGFFAPFFRSPSLYPLCLRMALAASSNRRYRPFHHLSGRSIFAVMVETGFNRTEMGKIILAACFINDIGTGKFSSGYCLLTTMSG